MFSMRPHLAILAMVNQEHFGRISRKLACQLEFDFLQECIAGRLDTAAMIFMPNLFWGPLVRNDFSFRKCTPPLAGSNPAVYIVGTMYLMRGIMMTKHKGFLSAHPLSNTFLGIIIYIYIYVDRQIYKIECYLHGARMSEHKVPQLSISRLSHFATTF